MNDITALRRNLHKHPELSGLEYNTAKTIVAFLEKYPPAEILQNLGKGTGVIAVYTPEKESKHTILFRCELDALPIQETNDFAYRSTVAAVSHKCGHDGHMSILCALAKKLHTQPMEQTTVLLLFQPAEENGQGALAIFNDERFRKLNPDRVFALHNIPGARLHDIIVKDHTFTCAVNSIIIKLHGRTAHAGEPFNGENPALALAEIVQEFQLKMQPDPHAENFTIMTPIFMSMGTQDYGISAGYGEVHYTFRRMQNKSMGDLEQELEVIAERIAKAYNLSSEIFWTQKFSANENDPETVNFVRRAATGCGYDLVEKKEPFNWGEDFGIFTEHYPGAMFGLGSGESTPALHNPDYDFPDEIEETGAEIFYKISQLIDAQ